MKRTLATLALIAVTISVGCHAQVPPASSGHSVVLVAIAPLVSGNWAGCTTSAPCTYAFYAESVSGSCDPTSSTNWKEITTPTARPSTPNFTDSNATGLTKCYDVETVQAAQNSAPSNVVGPVVVPGVPLAPTLSSPTVAELEKPFDAVGPQPTLAKKLPAPSGLKVVALR